MLKRLHQHPLLVGTAEVVLDALRYAGVMLLVIILLGQLVKLAGAGI